MKLLRILRSLVKGQRGFTLVELSLALCISGLLMGGVAATFYQIMHLNDFDNAQVIAVKQVENAIYNINRDVQMAQNISAQNNSSFPLVLTWNSWNADKTKAQISYNVTYNIDNQGNLKRQYSDSTGASTTMVLAQYVSTNPSATNCTYDSVNHKLTLQLTAIVSYGGKQVTEVRKVEIVPRPGS